MLMNLLHKSLWQIFLLTCLTLAVPAELAHADASDIFKQLRGSWRGSGDLRLSDGSRERITCRGYYVLKGRNGISLAILCSSPNYKVEIRSRLNENARGLSGDWEERTFNVRGDVSGSASNNGLKLAIRGAIRGSIAVSLRGKRQTVSITTDGTGFKGVSISFVRG